MAQIGELGDGLANETNSFLVDVEPASVLKQAQLDAANGGPTHEMRGAVDVEATRWVTRTGGDGR